MDEACTHRPSLPIFGPTDGRRIDRSGIQHLCSGNHESPSSNTRRLANIASDYSLILASWGIANVVKSWLVVTVVFFTLILLVCFAHRKHESWALSALLAVISLLVSVGVGERAYRRFAGRKHGDDQGGGK